MFLHWQPIAAAGAVLVALCVHHACAQSLMPQTGTASSKSLLDTASGGSFTQTEKSGTEEERIDPDRPHFPEATTTVGKDHVVLESGYTFMKKGSSFLSHAYPEALLRLGMFTDWFEFRVGQNLLHEEERTGGVTTITSGAQDLYLGMKLALTKQRDLLPAIAVVPQMTVPTGSSSSTANRVLPGLNVDLSWEVVRSFFSIEVVIANNELFDETRRSHFETATGVTASFMVTNKLELFAEWDAMYQMGGTDPGPRHYAVAGLVYFISPAMEVDARAGAGLSDRSNDVIAGAGFAVRF